MKSLLTFATILSICATAEATKYTIDNAHSSVVFKVSHLGFSHTYGQFSHVTGDFTLDDSKPEKSSLNLKIKADSLVTHDAKRDKHLRGPDFFNVKKNPWITYASTSVKKTGDSTYKVDGNLTLNGFTKPLTLTVNQNRVGTGPLGETRTGGDVQFTIKRSDFGIKYGVGENGIGDDVTLMVSIEGIRQ